MTSPLPDTALPLRVSERCDVVGTDGSRVPLDRQRHEPHDSPPAAECTREGQRWGHGTRLDADVPFAEASSRVIQEQLGYAGEDDDLEYAFGWSAVAVTQLERGVLTRHARDTAIRLLSRPLPGGYPEYFLEADGPAQQRAVFDATIAQLQAAVVVD